MASTSPVPSPPGKRPLPSDPLLGTSPARWHGGLAPWQGTFPFRATANLGPVAWLDIAPKAELAIRAGGFDLAFRQAPQYAPDPWGSTPLRPGIGYFVGEAQLFRLPHNAWLTAPSYSSVVTAVTLVADPVPTKRDLGAANRPVIWNVTAELGAVQSYDGADHHMGTRRFTKMLPTDPEFGWIPAAIIASLQ